MYMHENDLTMINNVHSFIDKSGEPLVFTLFCDGPFLQKFYAELRSNLPGYNGIQPPSGNDAAVT